MVNLADCFVELLQGEAGHSLDYSIVTIMFMLYGNMVEWQMGKVPVLIKEIAKLEMFWVSDKEIHETSSVGKLDTFLFLSDFNVIPLLQHL